MSDATDERRAKELARVAVEEIGIILTESMYQAFARAIRASDEAAGVRLVPLRLFEKMCGQLRYDEKLRAEWEPILDALEHEAAAETGAKAATWDELATFRKAVKGRGGG